MNLSKYILRPAEIVEVVDFKGAIRVVAPGIFSVEDDISLLPPVHPFISIHQGQFSKPVVGEFVWLMIDKSNKQLLYYIRKNNLPDNILHQLESLNEDINLEVILSRLNDDGIYNIMFSDSLGISLFKSTITDDDMVTDAVINLKPDNSIEIRSGEFTKVNLTQDDTIDIVTTEDETVSVRLSGADIDLRVKDTNINIKDTEINITGNGTVNIDGGDVVLNGGSNGGMVNINSLKSNLDALKKYIKDVDGKIDTIHGAIPNAFTAVGASTAALGANGNISYSASTIQANIPIIEPVIDDMEDTKSKH